MVKSMYIDKKILHICKYDYKYFFNKANVVGVGLGVKTKKGYLTTKKCIKIFVNTKLKRNQLRIKDIIPEYYKGILTDVVHGGNIYTSSLTNRIRPVPGGYSISTAVEFNSGSMACLVTDGNLYHVLGNSHVLNPRGIYPIDTEIIQPGKRDGGASPKDVIALLSKYIPINMITKSQRPENLVDCAIAKVIKRSDVYTQIALIGHINGITTPKVNEEVQKAGRITELTKGKIIALGLTQRVYYVHGEAIFKDQIATTLMSQSGDSGALLLDNNNYAVGLLFAGSSSYSYFNPIQSVLDSLNVTLVRR